MMRLFLIVVSLLAGVTQASEQVTRFGQYQLHYNTFESTFLQPNIASQYGFVRSKGTGLLNVAVTKDVAGETPAPQAAIVTATVTNLIGQRVKLEFTTIEEGDAIYYIAPFTKTNDEILKFSVSAKLNADAAPLQVEFQRHVYTD